MEVIYMCVCMRVCEKRERKKEAGGESTWHYTYTVFQAVK